MFSCIKGYSRTQEKMKKIKELDLFEAKMVTKSLANSMLALRIVALATSAATMALLVTDNYTFQNGAELKYQDFNSYR